MSFPLPWADALFAKLTVRYGSAFLAQWPDADPALIKSDWCDVLDGFQAHPEAIRYALANLPDKAPNAIAFRAIARRAPAPKLPQLPEPPADPKKVSVALETAKSEARVDRRSPAQRVLDGLIERARSNRLTHSQRQFISPCMAMLREDDPRRPVLARLIA